MPNEHIEVVKRWLEDNDAVSRAELKDNWRLANAAVSELTAKQKQFCKDNIFAADVAAARAALNAYQAAKTAGHAAAWVKDYEELTNDKRTHRTC